MKIGFSTWSFLPLPPLRAVNTIKSLGAEGIELWGDFPHFWLPHLKQDFKIKDFKKNISSFNENISIHAPAVNIADKNPGLRQEALRQVSETIKFASLIECRNVTVHPGRKQKEIMQGWDCSDEILKINLEGLKNITEEAEKNGVFICLENVNEHIGETPEELEVLIDALSSRSIKITLDIGHANLISHESINIFLKKFKEKLALIHISDNKGSKDEHLFEGEGNINFKEVFEKIKQIKFNGAIIGEFKWEKDLSFRKPKKFIDSHGQAQGGGNG